MNKMIL